MDDSLDILCSCAVLLFVAAVGATFGIRGAFGKTPRRLEPAEECRSLGLPKAVTAVALSALAPLARAAIALGISAKAVTTFSLVAGAGAGALLAWGHFGVAALLFVTASLGDALDGLVARATRTESAAGALFDASADRYEEFFAFAGLAIYFRSSGPVLALMLLALVGSFMVSYGSAKAESFRVAVPGGAMRRAERAVCLGVGTTMAPIAAALSQRLHGPDWLGELPVVAAAALIALSANLSAVRRLRVVAVTVSPPPPSAPEVVRRRAAPRGGAVRVDVGADAE
jgi:CDP-diacylglycerol--glycerol-3-phosphate 3-phosphatidyltransferase